MTAPHLARTEVRRLSRTTLGRAAIVAVLLVPLMYGALYLWAFWDPYGRLDAVPVALVDQDVAVSVDGRTVDAGHDLERTLRERGGFEWHVVDAAEAAEGLDAGRYHLVVTVPRDFSAALASPGLAPAGASGADGPRRAVLDVRTDDANGYIAGQLSRSVLAEIRQGLGSGSAKEYLTHVYASLDDLHTGLGQAATGATELADGASRAGDGARELATGTGRVADGARQLAAGADRLDDGVARLDAGASTARAGAARIAAGANRLDGGARDLATGLHRLDAGTAVLSTNSAQLADGSADLDRGAARLAAALRASADGTDDLGRLRASTARDVTEALTADVQAHPDADAVALAQRIQQDLAGLDRAATTASRTAATAAGDVSTGAHRVATGSTRLATGTSTVAAGAHRAAAAAARVSAGASALATGTQRQATGATELADGVHALASGTDRLADSTATLAARTDRVASGADDLTAGLVRLDDGATRLASRLATGADDVPAYRGSDAARRASVVADPVDLRQDPIHVASTYGAGFAPYFIPLAMWVGTVVAYLLLRPLAPRALASTARPGRVALGGWLPAAAIGIVQALALLAVLHWAIGLDAVHPVAVVAFLMLTAASFTALLQWVNARFGTPGKLIAIALLILQLTSAGGTYPIETAPRFFQVIHPWLPMTYVVTGLRHLISGGPSGAVWQAAGVLAGIAVAALALTTLTARRRRVWTPSRLHPELSL